MRAKRATKPHTQRNNKVTLTLTDQELEAVNAYCKKYKIASRSSLIREATVRFVMGRLVEDYPTLFQKNDLDRLIVY